MILTCTLSPTLTAQPIPTTGWARYSCTFTGSTTGTHHLYWKQTDAPGSARTFFIDAVQVETGSTASAFKDTGISLNGVINSPVVFKNVNDSTTAFQVQNSSGNNYLLVDTVGAIVSVGNTGIASTVQIGNTTGAVTQTINIGNNTTASSTTNTNIGSSIAGTTAITGPTTITNRTSGSADTFVASNSTSTGTIAKFQDNSTTVFSLADGGAALFQNQTNSATAFQVQNATGTAFLDLDTTQSNKITNGSFEPGTTGWSQKGSPTTFTRDTAEYYYGSASLKIQQAGANDGAKYNFTFLPTTNYAFSVYAKTTGSNFSTFEIGRAENGSDQSCATAQTVYTTGWIRITCTFLTGGTIGGSSHVYVKKTDGGTQTWWIDAAILDPGTSINTYREGTAADLNGYLRVHDSIQADGVLTLQGATNGQTGVSGNQAVVRQPFVQFNSDGISQWSMGLDTAATNPYDKLNDFFIGRQYNSGVSTADILFMRDYGNDTAPKISIGINYVPPPDGNSVSISAPANSNWNVLNLAIPAGSTSGNAIAVTSSAGLTDIKTVIDYQGFLGVGSAAPQNALTIGSNTSAGNNQTFAIELGRPSAPAGTPSGSGGSMATGTYYYIITALDEAGGQTIKGLQSSGVAVTGPTGSVALSWTAITGAVSYKVYRTTTSGTYTTPAYIANPTTSPYTDVAASPSAGAPPAATTAYNIKFVPGGQSYLNGGTTLGIGTSNPQNTLHVRGSADGIIRLDGGTNNQGFIRFNDSSQYLSFSVGASSNNHLKILSTGNVTVANDLGVGGDAIAGSDLSVQGSSDGIIRVQGGGSNQGFIRFNDAGQYLSLSVGASSNNHFRLDSNGSATFKNTTDSATAFQIQNAIGSAAFVADTTPLNTLINNGSVEGSDVSNWASKQNATVTRDTTQQYIGSASAKVVLGGSPAANDGVKYTPSPALAATGYVVSFSIKQTAGTAFGTNLAVGWNNGSDTNCTLSPTLTAQPIPTTGWARYSCTFTGSTTGTHHLYWKQTDAPGSARTFFIDAVQVETGSTASAFKDTGISLNGVINSPVVFKNVNDSTTAFQVQNSSGNNYLLVDTVGAIVSVGNTGIASTVQIGNTTGAVTQTINIGNNTTASSTTNTNIGSSIAGTTAITGPTTITNRTSGSADTFVASNSTSTGTIAKFQDNSTTVFSLADGGAALFQNQTNSATALQIQNAAGSTVFDIDTTDSNLITTNAGFELAGGPPPTGWINLGTGSATRVTTQFYTGFASSQVTAGTTAGGGTSANYTLTDSTQYTLSFYAKLDAASAALTTLEAGYSSTGLAGGETDCTWAGMTTIGKDATVLSTGWQRYVCVFTTAASHSGTPYVYIQHNDTTSEVFYVDAVQLEQKSYATAYGEGGISVNATFNSPAIFTNNSDSTTAFQIQKNNNITLFTVDTASSNQNNLVTNPSIEVPLASSGTWSARGSSTVTQSQDTAYNGINSVKVVTTAAANDGVKYTTGSSFLANGTTYTLLAYVKTTSTLPVTTFEVGHADDGTTPTDVNCLTAQTLTLGWTKFSCTWISGAITGTPYIYFKQTDAPTGGRTFYVDAVLLQTDANADSNYRDGKINFGNALFNAPVIFQNAQNSTTAFQLQNAGGTQVFNVDTTDTNLISNPGFETNVTGWTASGTGSIRRDTTQTYLGLASLKVVSQAAANSGAQFSLNPVVTAASTTYTISWYAKLDGGSAAFTDMIARYSPDGTATSDCSVTAINSSTVVTGGWTRYFCAVSSATAPTISGFIRIMQTGATAHTYYIDSIQLEATTVANMTAYGAGQFSFNGIFATPITLKSPSNSVSAFVVQNASGTTFLNLDTLNSTVSIGVTGSTAAASTVNIANTSGNSTQVVAIGSNGNTSNTASIDAGTGATAIQIGNTNTVHGIQIGSNATGDNDILLGGANSGSTLTLEGGTAATAIQIGNGGTAHGIQIGANAGNFQQAISVGSAGATTSTLIIEGGTAATAIQIGNGGTAHGIQIGTNATGANVITQGSTNSGSTYTLEAGTGATAIQIGNGTTVHGIQIGSNATGDNDILLGGANSGSTLTLEGGTAATAIQIGNGGTAHGIQIGANAGNFQQAISVGSAGATTSTLIIEGGTAATAIQIGNGGTAHGIQIGTNATGANVITQGSTNSGSTYTLEAGTGATAIQIGNGTTVHGIQIGSNATGDNDILLGGANSGSTLTLEGGTAATAIQIGNGNTAHGIQIGANAAGVQTIVIGNAVASSALTLKAGSGNALLNATSGTITISTTTSGQINLTPGGTSNITIGTSDTTGTLLVLDTDSDATVLSGVGASTQAEIDGAMFYSSTSRSFVCGQNGAWLSCLGGLRASNTAVSTALTTTSDTNFSGGTNNTYSVPANDCQAGRVYRITSYGTYTNGSTATTGTMKVKFGATTLGTSPAFVLTASVTHQWSFEGQVTCIDATHVEAQGHWIWFLTASTSTIAELVNTATVTQIVGNAQVITLSGLVSQTVGAPSITQRQIVVEGLGP